jgi:hypothetical protein
VRYLIQLTTKGFVQARVIVPVHIAPQAADAVEPPPSMHIDQLTSFSPFNKPRLVLGHLRKGVPDVVAIPLLVASDVLGVHH